ncbi:hypothetical protein EJB05_03724, partial [Eragrostis curvula]
MCFPALLLAGRASSAVHRRWQQRRSAFLPSLCHFGTRLLLRHLHLLAHAQHAQVATLPAMAAAAQRLLAASTKIIGVGRNYIAHAKELGNPVPKEPVLFLKPTSSLLHAGGVTTAAIEVPEPLESLHHEVELAVVISQRGRDVPEASAMDFVGGYALALDMTARDLQSVAKVGAINCLPWTLAKGQDTFTPISAVVPKSAVPNPDDLELWLKVDDELKQKGPTSDMIFKIPFLISYISSIMTLMEGDVILTGTPEGVGPVRVGQKIKAGITDLIDVEFDVDAEHRLRNIKLPWSSCRTLLRLLVCVLDSFLVARTWLPRVSFLPVDGALSSHFLQNNKGEAAAVLTENLCKCTAEGDASLLMYRPIESPLGFLLKGVVVLYKAISRLAAAPFFSCCSCRRRFLLRRIEVTSPAAAMVKYSTEPVNPTKAAKAMGRDLRVHFKNTRETAFALRKLPLTKAKRYLEDVIAHKQAIPFRRYCGGVGRTAQAKNRQPNGQGRWPAKSARFILDLLKNAESNAEVKGLDVDALYISHIQVNQAQKQRRRTYRAHGRINPYMSSPCHIELILSEKEEPVKKEAESQIATRKA